MDQDTYEQLMQIQISMDELEEKMNLVLDEIDDLKKNMEERSCGYFPGEQQGTHTLDNNRYEMPDRDAESRSVLCECVTRNVLVE